MNTFRTALSSLALFALAACAANRSADVYTEDASGGTVLRGTVVSARPVTIKASDRLGDNGYGVLGGGAAGAAVGSGIGQGSGNATATVGGAILGAVAGALIQEALSTSQGYEYLVEVDQGHKRSEKSKTKKELKIVSKGGPQENLENSIDTDLETNVISVVQADKTPLAAGSRVYVVYNNDRPRVVPASSYGSAPAQDAGKAPAAK